MNSSFGETGQASAADSFSADLGWIPAALVEMDSILSSKNEDYRIDGEFSNFEFAANASGVGVQDVIVTQIGIKLGRLKGLGESAVPNHESILDTIKDLHGYAAILHAWSMKESQ